MNLKDELHDIKVLGGARNYVRTLWQLRVVHEWDAWRCAAEKKRAENKERRLMKSSTYDALAERAVIDETMTMSEQALHEDLLADTIAVERRRWIERGYWCFAIAAVLGLGFVAGWNAQPQFAPQPWDCLVKFMPDAPLVEPTILRCIGGEKP